MDDVIIKNKKPVFFSLYEDKFSFKWLFRYGFYRIIWFGIVAKFGFTSLSKKPGIRKLKPYQILFLTIPKRVCSIRNETEGEYLQRMKLFEAKQMKWIEENNLNALAIFISIGRANPLQHLIDDGYNSEIIGYVFNEPIVEYTKFVNAEKI